MAWVTDPSPLSSAAIREYAERVGNQHSIYDQSGAADVRELVRTLGGRIEYADTQEASHVFGPGNFVIYLPHVTSSRRDRFTIAHELGHYFLHYLHPRKQTHLSFGRGMRNAAETQANVFAASLLMPREKFTEWFERTGGDTFRVASILEVSPAAADVQAQVLGLKR